jgi:hypothetical protein
MKRRTRKRTIQDDEKVAVRCLACGHEHSFPSLDALESTSRSTPCARCGFLYINHMAQKMDAMLLLLDSDPHAGELLRAGDMDRFGRYFAEKTGFEWRGISTPNSPKPTDR